MEKNRRDERKERLGQTKIRANYENLLLEKHKKNRINSK